MDRALAAIAAACILLTGCASGAPRGTLRQRASSGREAWRWMTASLPGTWSAVTRSGRRVRESFRLVSNDSALVETFASAGGHETLSVYHPDGDGLVLTHYCAQGNQPRLRSVEATADRARFVYADATNLRPDQEVMVERVLQRSADGFEQTETYRRPDGARETTTLRFVREPTAQP